MPVIKEMARRTEEHLKGMVVPGTLFEELGFNYIGPIDGHDVDAWWKPCVTCAASRGHRYCIS